MGLALDSEGRYGTGAAPEGARPLLRHIGSGKARLAGLGHAVCGFGSSDFPRFCGGAAEAEAALARGGALLERRLCPTARVDARGDARADFDGFVGSLAAGLVDAFGGRARGLGAVDRTSRVTPMTFAALAALRDGPGRRDPRLELLAGLRIVSTRPAPRASSWLCGGCGAAVGEALPPAAPPGFRAATVSRVEQLLAHEAAPTSANRNRQVTLVELDLTEAGDPSCFLLRG